MGYHNSAISRVIRYACLLAAGFLAFHSVWKSATACGLCVTPGGLVITHPKSLEIAIAIRREIDEGRLENKNAIPTDPSDRHFSDLQAARILVERLQLREGIELLLVEDSSRYRIENAQELHRGKRVAVPSIRWVTGRAALHAMLKGDLELDVATKRGLLVIEEATAAKAGCTEAQMQARRRLTQ